MPDLVLRTETEAEDLIRGLTLLGTGGGGRPELGRLYLQDALKRAGEIRIRDVSAIPDEAWFCSTFGMGSTAPRPAVAELPEYGPKIVEWPMVEALRELERYTGLTISGVVAFEIGAANTAGPLHTATVLGLLFPDGDCAGRAVPESAQSTPALHGKQYCPSVMCDPWGNVIIMKKTANLDVAERFGKALSIVTKLPDQYTPCNYAGFLLTGAELRQWIVPGTVSKSLRVGQAIRQAREAGKDPVLAATDAMNGWLLFRGTVASKEWESREGYMYGSATMEGSGEFAGHTLKIWYKNETHISWLDAKPFVTSPDLICIVRAEDGEPITNTVLEPGTAVAVLGAPAPWYRTDEGLEALGPKHFGFDIDYVPIEQLVGQRSL